MFTNLILILIFIFPLFGKSFNYIESIFFYGFSILIFFYSLIHQKKFFLSPLKLSFLSVLIALFLLSTVFSQNFGVSYYAFFTFLTVLLFALTAIFEIDNSKFQIGIMISSLIYSLIFLLNKIGLIPLERDIIGDNFILKVWGHSYLAELLVLSIPIFLYFLADKKIKSKILLFIAFLLVFISLILTNSRSALFSLGIGLFFLDFKQPLFQKLKKIFILLIFIISIIFSILVLQNKFTQKSLTGSREYYIYSGLIGFIHHPILGNGPNTFPLIVKKYQLVPFTNTNLAHNSLIAYLSENGLLFTAFFLFLIIYSLIKTRKKNNLFFVCGLIAFIHSFLDPTWNSPGILIISLYLIFYYEFKTNGPSPIKNLSRISFSILAFFLLLFFISKTTSDFFFLKGKLNQSLIFDPFNLNPRIALLESQNLNPNQSDWAKNLEWTLKLFPNHELVYKTIIKTIPLSDSEPFFYKLFEINPKEANENYYELISYYYNNKQEDKLEKILDLADKNFKNNQSFSKYSTLISKASYSFALSQFQTNPQKAIKFFQIAVNLFPILGHYHIELANAYWYTGQSQKAIDQLIICQKYSEPQKHCQWYLEEHKLTDFDQPGQEYIINYLNEKIKL